VNEYDSSTQTIGDAYEGYNEKFVDNLKVDWKAHEERVNHMHEVFHQYFAKAGSAMGCNQACTMDAFKTA
jgi:hypothetical protein